MNGRENKWNKAQTNKMEMRDGETERDRQRKIERERQRDRDTQKENKLTTCKLFRCMIDFW